MSHPQTNSLSYRPELDGLRALAIIPVILFHLHPEWLPGGFLGVDVFFVLSGFLITSTILPKMSGCSEVPFSFRDFYFRRVKRLLPAILTLILVLQCFGSLILFDSEWRSLSAQAGSVLGIFSNFFFWKNAGNYWGQAAETMPLLHAWSLSVEEQFYLLFPIALALTLRLKWPRRAPFWLIAAAALLSFGGFFYARRHFPDAGFFWSIFRAWELLAGCLIALHRHSHPRSPEAPGKLTQWLPLLGLALVLAGYWSGWGISVIGYRNAAATVLGTCLVLLWADQNSRLTGHLLTLPPLVGIGLISYSLYLWHWPVIVFSRFAGLQSWAAMLLITLALAYASYRWVEKPLRFCPTKPFLRRFSALLAATLLSLLLPFVIARGGPIHKYKIPEFTDSINLHPNCLAPHYGTYKGSRKTGLSLFSTDQGPAEVVVLGDSHSMAFFPAIRQSCESLGLRLAFFGATATSPFLIEPGASATEYGYGIVGKTAIEDREAFDEDRVAFIAQAKPRFVFICARWKNLYNENRFSEHLERLREACGASQIIFLGQPPELPFGSEGFTSGSFQFFRLRKDSPMAADSKISGSELPDATHARRKIHQRLQQFCASTSHCHFVDTEQYFLRDGQPYFIEGETLFYHDDDHLSVAGALRVVPAIEEILTRLK